MTNEHDDIRDPDNAPDRELVVKSLGFDEDHRVGPSREGRSIKRSHRAEGRNWVD